MLPILYLILMKRNGTPYSEVTVVSLPSSLMIVHSNAFVFSTSLPEVVFRYGFYLNKKKWQNKSGFPPCSQRNIWQQSYLEHGYLFSRHAFSRTSLNFSYRPPPRV